MNDTIYTATYTAHCNYTDTKYMYVLIESIGCKQKQITKQNPEFKSIFETK